MEITRELKRKILLFIFISLASFMAAWFIHFNSIHVHDLDMQKQKHIEKVLREKEQMLQKVLDLALQEKFEQAPFINLHKDLHPEQCQKEGWTVFIYRNDSLVYWSDNNVPAGISLDKNLFSSPFIHYGNGWFRVITSSGENIFAVGLILVKNDFPYQNKYLVNEFQEDFKLDPHVIVDTIPGQINFYSAREEFLFSVSEAPSESGFGKTNLFVFTLFLTFFISLIILLFYLYQTFVFLRERPFLLLLAFAVDTMILRLIFLYFEIPTFLYQTDLFSPYYYATSFISPSLGDLVINSITWLTLAWIFYSKCNASISQFRYPVRIFLGALISLSTGFLFFLLVSTMRRLIIDSNIELNLNNIFNIDIYSSLGFISLTSLILAFFLVSSRLISMISERQIKIQHYLFIALATSACSILLFLDKDVLSIRLIFPAFLFLYLVSFLYFNKKQNGFRNITGAMVYVLMFSLITTLVLDIYHARKEKETRKIIASELSSKRDPLMEYEFSKIVGQIQSDSNLSELIMNWYAAKENSGYVYDFIREKYFNNFWNKYDIQMTICAGSDVLNIQPAGYLESCFTFFNRQTQSAGSEPIDSNLFFINDKLGNSNYLSILDLPGSGKFLNDSVRIYIEIFQKYIYETGLGYPDLLIDEKVNLISGLENYSYAKYVDGKLIYKNGDFSYNLGFQTYDAGSEQAYFMDNEGYNHYIIKENNHNALMISKKNLSFLDLIAPFSYLFILFSLFLLVFMFLFLLQEGIHQLEFNFSNQLQVSIISIIIISFFILGIITRANIIHLYNKQNRDNLSEKTFSVLTELEHKLGNAPALTDDMESYIEEILYKFSVIFYSDINLFDTGGSLIASSRPQIFHEELLSTKMNSRAFHKLFSEQSLLYIQNEKIGRQEYLSAYIPFRNNEDRIIAYLNLPYFSKQNELKKEIGDFLAAYINVYVLLIVLAVVVTIIVSRFISRPLQLVREKLSVIRLGKSNEKIDWRRKDEIGNLVEEYNRMIDELARSAELLARSERESAWREMARQVAHEIKNPLTPMKLSVQYLQKAWIEKSPDWEAHLHRFTKTIVEQIDSLSEIASEFSDFAKMPAANIEKTDLMEVIKSAAELYRSHRQTKIIISQLQGEFFVMADKRQLLRVFNNLVQNAVQAIGKKADGVIRINVLREGDKYHISVSDNGTGITEEQAGKIFSPSFTTKSSGMGLGLAMSKSILNTVDATITFESKAGEGTTFHILIPVCEG